MIRRSRNTIGCLEPVSLPELGVYDVLAKIDTGAFSGALHCTDVKVVRKGPSKRRVLRFNPLGNPKLHYETDQFEETYVRSATGHRQKRFIITTNIKCGGRLYETKIGVSDRSDMKRPVLIGRRFLRENKLLVDVRINSELDDEGENTR